MKHMGLQYTEILRLPWRRRQRALKWISFMKDHEAQVAKSPPGHACEFDKEGLLDVVWRAPANSSFGV
jgi:hypothetical protein